MAEPNSSDILKGVSICLTGFAVERKGQLHSLVAKLGGRFTKDLLTKRTTHLIAEQPGGAKFDEAVKHSQKITIVSPKWLEQCEKEKTRLSTDRFLIVQSVEGTASNTLTQDEDHISLVQDCDEMLSPGKLPPNPLFSGLCFYFVGFDDDEEEEDENAESCRDGDSTRQNGKVDLSIATLKQKLFRLIRRGMGTILWDLSDRITHVVVCQNCNLKARTAISNFCRNHPNCPAAISPQWIVSSQKKRSRQLISQFPPLRPASKPKLAGTKRKLPSKAKTTTLFKGYYFHFTKTQSSSNFVSFNSDNFQTSVVSHAGQILTNEILNQLGSDGESSEGVRLCFVVRGHGLLMQETDFASDVLLDKISKKSNMRMKEVSPLWIQTCIQSRMVVKADSYPMLFQPQSFPLHKLPLTLNDGKKLQISVTGFVGLERIGLKHLIICIGGLYTEKMSIQNTHLICKEAKGPKFSKAHEWKLHVITVEWLYHIIQHGYYGESAKSLRGCEEKFNLSLKE